MKAYIKSINDICGITRIVKKSILFIILVLVLDKLNIVSPFVNNDINKAIITLIGVFIIIQLYESNIIKGLKLKVINCIDEGIIYGLVISALLSFIYYLLGRYVYSYKFYLSLYVLAIMIIILIIRIYCFSRGNMEEESLSNVYDLKDIYDGKVVVNKGLILINEEDVYYDLLGRGNIIDNIYSMAVNSNPKNKFVISLEGPWGSGKSTILNIVTQRIAEKNSEIVLINDFDPWAYNDQCSMFKGMFDTILKNSGIKYSISNSSKLIEELYSLLFDNKYGKRIQGLSFLKKDSRYEIKKIKEMINSYLTTENKKIVFIIDNIDRATKENINLIFRLVSTVFDFKGVVYILSFDETRVKRMLEEERGFEYEYLKKVIQLQIKVPVIDDGIKNSVIKTCINNLLVAYGEKQEDLHKYKTVLDSLSSLIRDIRDFKRFLNSAITFSYNSNEYLNMVDLIVIEFIKISNNDLYVSIIENSQFYIFYDREFNENSREYIIGIDKFNEDGKAYFDRIFNEDNNKKYLKILSEIFPYVKLYSKESPLRGKYVDEDRNFKEEVLREARICSAKYFDLYFTQTRNEFIVIRDYLDEFVNNINQSQDSEQVYSYVLSLINNYQKDWHKVIFESLQLYLGKIMNERLLDLAIGLFNNIYEIDNSMIFLGINAKDRVMYILSDIVIQISNDDFDKFLNYIGNRYELLREISILSIRVNKENSFDNKTNEERSSMINKLYIKMSKYIYDNNIDIYDKYYSYRNIWGLYHGLKDEEEYDIKNYINVILNSKNIIRFMYDMVSVSLGSVYMYRFDGKSMESLTSKEKLINLLKSREIKSEDEAFVIELFNNYIDDKKDDFGESITIKGL